MALEKGNEDEIKKDELSDKEVLKQFQLNMQMMQRELDNLKKTPNVAAAPGGMSDEQFKQFMKVVAEGKDAPDTKRLTVKTFVEERDIDPADYDERGVLFCAYSTGYLIVDDVRQGFPVPTPFGNAIMFMFTGQNKTRDNQGNMVLNTFCSYQSKSKKEQKWLREHRYFGIKFFESAKEALSTDAIRAQKLLRYVDVVMSMDQHQIVQNCKAYGVGISEDMRVMRIQLANKMLDKVDGKEDHTHQILKNNLEEKLFLEDPGKTTPERVSRD